MKPLSSYLHTVLVVDDERSIFELFTLFLEGEGISLLFCESADEAFGLLEGRADRWHGDPRVDLVITDWGLPGRDGLALLEQIRNTAWGAELPITLMSGSMNRELMSQVARTTAESVLRKPLVKALVLSKIREIMGREKPQAKTSEPASALAKRRAA